MRTATSQASGHPRCGEEQQALPADHPQLSQDGTPFWNELSITPVFNEADQLTYFIGIQKNVTAEVDALQRVEALEAEIRELKAKLAEH